MKKLTTTVVKNGKTKTVSVWVDDRTAEALEQVNDEEFTRQYILDEHRVKLDDYRETRRHQSLDASMDHGLDIPDDYGIEDDIFMNIEFEKLRTALEILTPAQRELIERVYFDGIKQSEIAEEQGVDPTAIRNRLNKIYKKIKNFLI